MQKKIFEEIMAKISQIWFKTYIYSFNEHSEPQAVKGQRKNKNTETHYSQMDENQNKEKTLQLFRE